MKGLVVRMTPTGALSGRVLNRDKQPQVGVTLQLLRFMYAETGRGMLRTYGEARTDDQGENRFYFVTPGRYYLNAGTPPGFGDTLRSGPGLRTKQLNRIHRCSIPVWPT